jgi:hypothetical protein
MNLITGGLRLGGSLLGGLGKAAGGAARTAGRGALAVGGGLLGGLGSGLLGGKLGGSGSSGGGASPGGSQQQSSYPRISSIFAPTSMNTRVSGPQTIKDNCCCCDQTISLLSSIDETLKRSLYVSQATNLANKENAAEGGDRRVAGLGGRTEAMGDSAEKAGFGLGSMIASTIGLALISNLGPLIDTLQDLKLPEFPNLDFLNPTGGGIDEGGLLGGGVLGAMFGGKRKIAGAAVGAVLGSDITQGVYQAKSEEGKMAGLAGSILGGVGVGAAGGSLFGPVGAVVGGILGGIFGEDLFEGLGDVFAGKFNENTEETGKDIGKKAGEELNKSFKPTISSIGTSSDTGIPNFGADFVSPYTTAKLAGFTKQINEESEYDEMFKKYGEQYGVPWKELKMRAVVESGLNPNAANKSGAVGLMQFIPETAEGYGLNRKDRTDPEKSIAAGARLMADLMKKADGDMSKVDMMYYGGESGRAWGPNTNQYAANLDALRRKSLVTPPPKRDSEEMLRMAEAAAGGEFYRPVPQVTPQAASTVVINNSGGQTQRQVASIPSIEAPRTLPHYVTQFPRTASA